MAGTAKAGSDASVARAGAVRPGEEAAAEVLAQLDYGEAAFVGLVGDTGTGKTTALDHLIKLYLRKSAGSVFIIDDKELRPRFAGQERRDVADLRARPIDPDQPDSRVIIFRGEPTKGILADPEEIAQLAWARVQRGRKTLVVIDELIAGREEQLSKNTQWRKGVEFVPRCFNAGRAVGVSVIWGAQSPQEVPRGPFEQSNAILTFRLAGMGLRSLRERNYLEGGAEEVIPRFHGPPDPPAVRGDFALLRRGAPWNGKTYKFTRGGG
jgi:ABC-type cobalamin/Fe3+-siderophores transport system ATPase subunit